MFFIRQHARVVITLLVLATVGFVVTLVVKSAHTAPDAPFVPSALAPNGTAVEFAQLACGVQSCLDPDEVKSVTVSDVLDLSSVSNLRSATLVPVGDQPAAPAPLSGMLLDTSRLSSGEYLLTITTDISAFQVLLVKE